MLGLKQTIFRNLFTCTSPKIPEEWFPNSNFRYNDYLYHVGGKLLKWNNPTSTKNHWLDKTDLEQTIFKEMNTIISNQYQLISGLVGFKMDFYLKRRFCIYKTNI
jgi:hypothetical protein